MIFSVKIVHVIRSSHAHDQKTCNVAIHHFDNERVKLAIKQLSKRKILFKQIIILLF